MTKSFNYCQRILSGGALLACLFLLSSCSIIQKPFVTFTSWFKSDEKQAMQEQPQQLSFSNTRKRPVRNPAPFSNQAFNVMSGQYWAYGGQAPQQQNTYQAISSPAQQANISMPGSDIGLPTSYAQGLPNPYGGAPGGGRYTSFSSGQGVHHLPGSKKAESSVSAAAAPAVKTAAPAVSVNPLALVPGATPASPTAPSTGTTAPSFGTGGVDVQSLTNSISQGLQGLTSAFSQYKITRKFEPLADTIVLPKPVNLLEEHQTKTAQNNNANELERPIEIIETIETEAELREVFPHLSTVPEMPKRYKEKVEEEKADDEQLMELRDRITDYRDKIHDEEQEIAEEVYTDLPPSLPEENDVTSENRVDTQDSTEVEDLVDQAQSESMEQSDEEVQIILPESAQRYLDQQEEQEDAQPQEAYVEQEEQQEESYVEKAPQTISPQKPVSHTIRPSRKPLGEVMPKYKVKETTQSDVPKIIPEQYTIQHVPQSKRWKVNTSRYSRRRNTNSHKLILPNERYPDRNKALQFDRSHPNRDAYTIK